MSITSSTNERFVPPDLAEFLSRRMRDISARINCHMIGTIRSFDATNQTATVAVNFQKTIKGVNPLNSIAESSDMVINYPALVNVPVMFAQGGGAYLTFPISPGDTCVILFADRDMDIWFSTAQIAPPNSDRVHDINDAIAIVGLRDLQHSLAGYSTDKAVLGFPNGIISVTDRTGERLSEPGDIKATGRASAPSGWLICDGAAISRTTYDLLFAAIGTAYGSGNGSTTFNIPDGRGKVLVGLDSGTFKPLGHTGGEETHTLTIPEMPIHHHVIQVVNIDTGNGGKVPWDNQTSIQGTYNTDNAGGDGPHNNLQPYLTINWLIKI